MTYAARAALLLMATVAMTGAATAQQAYGDTVLLMLVDDFLAALRGMLEYVTRDEESQGSKTITAPVQLRWNETYRSAVAEALEGMQER